MSTTEKLKLIRAAFEALEFLNNIRMEDYCDDLYALALDEEKQHRGFGPDFAKYHANAISAHDAARLFAVKRIAEYLSGERMPRGKDYISTQKSCFLAAALVDQYRKEIRSAWRKFDVRALAALDYCEFVKAAA